MAAKLKTKMLLLLLVPTIILISFMTVYTYLRVHENVESEVMLSNKIKVNYFGEQIKKKLVVQETAINQILTAFENKSLSPAEYRNLVLGAKNSAKYSDEEILNVMIALADKTYVASNGWIPTAGYDARQREWYKNAMADASGNFTYSSVYKGASTGEMMTTVSRAIVVNGRKIGVVGVDIKLSAVFKPLERMKYLQTDYTFVIDSKGALIGHPEFTSEDNLAEVEDGALAGFLEKVKAEGAASSVAAIKGVEKMYTAAPISGTGWTIVSAVNEEELFGSVDGLTMVIAFTGFMVVLLLGAMILYTTLSITKPIQKMTVMAEKFMNGDFRQTQIDVARSDEIGHLAEVFSAMGADLRKLINSVSTSAEQVAASSEELTASADQSAQAADQVAGSITNVAESTAKQVQHVHTANTSVEEMASILINLKNNAGVVKERADEAAQKAGSGNETIGKAVRQMESIETSVGASAKVVGALGERSKEIGQIVDTISGLAGQTNLLALNAAIEAARAGEQGKGFAVVAEEVRKLAEQSRDAAENIAKLIQEIQADTENAVTAMQSGTQEVKTGAEVVNEAGETFKEIERMIVDVNEQVGMAQLAMRSIVEKNEEIVAAVQEIERTTASNAEETHTVSAATEEQSASMVEIATASQSLADLAQQLQSAIGKFKV